MKTEIVNSCPFCKRVIWLVQVQSRWLTLVPCSRGWTSQRHQDQAHLLGHSDTCAYPERFNACCFVSACNPHLFEDYYEVNKRGEFRTSFDFLGRHFAERSGFSSPYMSPPFNSSPPPIIPQCHSCMSSKRSQPAKKLPLATQYRFWSSAGACAGSAVPSSTDCDEGEPPRLSLACRIRTARRKARSVSRWRGAKLQVMYPQRLRI